MWWRTLAATLDVSIVGQQAATLWESCAVLSPRVRRTTRSIHHISSLIDFLAGFLSFPLLHFLFSFLCSFEFMVCSLVSFSVFLCDCCSVPSLARRARSLEKSNSFHELHFSDERHAREGGEPQELLGFPPPLPQERSGGYPNRTSTGQACQQGIVKCV